ncbi:MAG: DUF2029 domain-containing protein [Thermoleophilaceae bacterium]|nr:DUF2029 domain-containing protein [Thermoleophilaceae bacterium]
MAVLLVAVAAGLATFLVAPWSSNDVTDIGTRESQARALTGGSLPYRGMAFEYPPLAAPLIAAPTLAGTGPERYEIGFGVMTIVFGLIAAVLAAGLASQTAGSPLVAALALAAGPLLLGPITRTQFDIAAVTALLAALLLALRRHPAAAGAALGIGVAIKVFPVVAAPVLLAWLAARLGRAAVLRGILGLGVTVALVVGFALALSPSGFEQAIEYQLDRPAQIESAQASVLLAVGVIEGRPPVLEPSRASVAVIADESVAVGIGFALLLISLLALLSLGAARAAKGLGEAHGVDRALVLAALTMVAGFALLGRVISPQYAIWVLPLLAMALAWRQWALAAAAGAACVLTFVEFPFHYVALTGADPFATWLVGLRNLALAVAVALGLLGVAALSPRDRRPR